MMIFVEASPKSKNGINNSGTVYARRLTCSKHQWTNIIYWENHSSLSTPFVSISIIGMVHRQNHGPVLMVHLKQTHQQLTNYHPEQAPSTHARWILET